MFEIYSRNDCIYCTKFKDLLRHYDLEYTEYTIGDEHTKESIQKRAGADKKINTIPQVFFDGEHLGGYIEGVEFIAYGKHNG